MTLLVVGISHKTAPVEFRERIAFPEATLPRALGTLIGSDIITEAVILSTCNRTELYVNAKSAPLGTTEVCAFIQNHHSLSPAETDLLREHMAVEQSDGAIRHLFRVVSSLDSMVLGEAQILGQVRQAFITAQEAGTTGSMFNRLFKQALELGKKVRTATQIGANSVSVSTAAVNLVNRVFDSVEGLDVILVGSGQMGQLTAQYLQEKGARRILIANRTLENAQLLAGDIGGKAIPFNVLADYLAQADLLISSTAAQDYVVDKAVIAKACKHRRGRPLLLVDIALPRDIDPACGDLPDVYLYDLDDLGLIIDDNIKERESEALKVESMVQQGVEAFLTWLQECEVKPTIKHMFEKAEATAARECERAAKALAAERGAPLSEKELAVLEAMSSSIVKKILHGPTARLYKQASDPDSYRYTQAARYLFGLDTHADGHSCKTNPNRLCRVKVGKPCSNAEQGRCDNACA